MDEQYLDWLASLPRETARLTNAQPSQNTGLYFQRQKIHRLVAPDISVGSGEMY